jgi:hypothetical protein
VSGDAAWLAFASDEEDIQTLMLAISAVALATGPLLAWLHDDPSGGYECRCCRQLTGHDPVMPCGQLHARVEALSAAVRAVVGKKGGEGEREGEQP